MPLFVFLEGLMNITEKIEQIILPLLNDENMELVDIQFVSESGKRVLRIFLDKNGGIKLSDCEVMSDKIGSLLDKEDIIQGSYVLEISSPGLDRILKKEKDFVRFIGHKARITVFSPINKQRNFIGIIKGYDAGKVLLQNSDGGITVIELKNIAKARLEPDI